MILTPFLPLKPLNNSLENWPWEKKKGLLWSNPIARNTFFFRSTFFQCACVHKKWGLTHRPQSWLTTSGRSSVGSETVRNRGATPKCHHSCKTAEHKSQITEICTLRPPDNENRAAFEWLLPELCSGSCPALCFVGFTMSKELQIPQLLADIRVHVWVVVWEFILGQLCYYHAMLLLIKLMCCSLVHSCCMREGLADNWLHYADIYPNDMDVLIHSCLNIFITSLYHKWLLAVIIS